MGQNKARDGFSKSTITVKLAPCFKQGLNNPVMNLLHRLQLRVYLFWAVVVGFILLSALMVYPFVSAIISAYILAFLVRPLSVHLRPRFGRTGSALICIVVVILLVIVPVTFISLQLLDQVGEVSRGHGIADLLATSAAQPLLST